MATAKPKTQIGTMACLCCGHEIPVKQAEGGTLHAACPWCDFPAYAKPGTQAHTIISGKVKGKAAPEPAPAAVAKPAPEPAPAPRKPRSVFDL